MRPFLGWAASVIGLCAAMGGIRECLSAYSPAPENPSSESLIQELHRDSSPSDKRKRSSSGPSEKKRRLSSGEPSRKIEEKDCRMKNITHVRDDGVSIEYCSINGMTLQKNFFYTSKKTANGNEKYFTITCAGSSFQTHGDGVWRVYTSRGRRRHFVSLDALADINSRAFEMSCPAIFRHLQVEILGISDPVDSVSHKACNELVTKLCARFVRSLANPS